MLRDEAAVNGLVVRGRIPADCRRFFFAKGGYQAGDRFHDDVSRLGECCFVQRASGKSTEIYRCTDDDA